MAGGERGRFARMAAGLAAGALLAGAAPAMAATSRVFAPVPSPGQPEGIVVAPDGTVYAATDAAPYGVRPDGTPPSKVFAFGPDGTLRNQWTIQGETRDGTTSYGLFGLALDRNGVIYAVEHSPRRSSRSIPGPVPRASTCASTTSRAARRRDAAPTARRPRAT